MINNVDDAASAFRAADPVPAGAFEDTVRGPQASQTLQQIMTIRPGWAARRRWLRPRFVAAPLAGIAAAAAIALVLLTGSGGPTTLISTAAYTAKAHPDGTVSLYFNPARAFTDPAGLSRALSSHGVRNRVLVSRRSCPPGSDEWGKEASVRGVLTNGPAAGSFVVHPGLMPHGVYLVIAVVASPGTVMHNPSHVTSPADGISAISVGLNYHPGTCFTYAGGR